MKDDGEKVKSWNGQLKNSQSKEKNWMVNLRLPEKGGDRFFD